MNKPEPNDYKILTMQSSNLKHGGNVYAKATNQSYRKATLRNGYQKTVYE